MRWRFECPHCGYDDEEAGRLLSDDELLCPLCWEDSLHAVRVIRWAPGEARNDAGKAG